MTHDEISRRWPEVLAGWRRRPWETWAPGGESPGQVQERVRPALAAILERLGRDYPRGTLDRPQVGGYAGVGPQAGQPWSILVGHDGVFKVVMLTLFDLPLTHFWMFTMALTGHHGGRVPRRPAGRPGREPHGAPGAAPRRARAGAGGAPGEVRGAVGPGSGAAGGRSAAPRTGRLARLVSGAGVAAGGAGRA